MFTFHGIFGGNDNNIDQDRLSFSLDTHFNQIYFLTFNPLIE